MQTTKNLISRRNFLRTTATVTTGITGISMLPLAGWSSCMTAEEDNINIIGPITGYSPQIGTLVTMMNWMRNTVLMSVKGMQQSDLDYLHDSNANTIGAMLLHLAATERFYQLHTLEGKKWGTWDDKENKEWGAASELGDAGRKAIKGNNLDYYLDKLQAVRQHTLDELKKKDDQWLLSVDKQWYWGPTNNYCKWFHVCEHESNHNGQIKWIKSRLPGAKKGGE